MAEVRRAVRLLCLCVLAACPAAEPPQESRLDSEPAAAAEPTAGFGAGPIGTFDEAEVRVLYDRHRIPHIQAASDRGVFFGLGYQQVRDFPVATLASLWSGTGRFAEVAGRSVLGRDEHILTFGIDDQARREESDPSRLDPEVRTFLEAYTAGVEAGRRWWLEHPSAIEALAGEDGQAMHFDPVPAWLDPFFARDRIDARLQRLFEGEITLFHVLSLGAVMNGGAEFIGAGYALTNVWSVRNAAREADASPASVSMTVDSHQPIKRGGARAYLVQMSGRDYAVAGYSMPGYPCIVLGFNRALAFSNTSLPQAPRRIQDAAALPFRFQGDAPVVSASWEAQLEPDAPARLRVGDRVVPLDSRTLTLSYWDVEKGALVADERGPRTFHRVPELEGELGELGLWHPVLDPAPGEPIDPSLTRRIRFEGRSFLAARNPMEFWIRVGMASHVGPGAGGLDEVLEKALLCFGRGQAFQVVDALGGMQFVWSSLVPIPGSATLENEAWRKDGKALLDGNDPAQRWRGLHPFQDLPRMIDRGFGERAEVWINSNDSPHVMRAAGFDDHEFHSRDYVMEPVPWKSLRHDRSRALLERAAADGEVTADELEEAALDVQDPWAVRMWPLLRTLSQPAADAGAAEGEELLSAHASELLHWIDRLRFEDALGLRGDEEFLAHPMSQVTVFTSLIHHGYEGRMLNLEQPEAHELALGMDPMTPLPTPGAFRSEQPWARCRAALRATLEDVSRLHRASTAGEAGRLTTRDLLLGRVDELSASGPWSRAQWLRLLDAEVSASADEEAADLAASPVPARWGQVHLYTLTPHARRTFPPALLERALSSILAPGQLAGSSFHSSMSPVVYPAGGTGDSIFQLHAEGFRATPDALFPRSDGTLMLLPVDFGSQLLWSVELRRGMAPRARFLAALGSTEITCALSESGIRAGDHVGTLQDFAAGRWSDFELDPLRLQRGARRVVTLFFEDGEPESQQLRLREVLERDSSD